MAREMLGVLVMGLLLAMVPQKTMQLPMNHPLFYVLKRSYDMEGPYIGLILSTNNDEKQLLETGYFVPNPAKPIVDIAGRTFNLGTFRDVPTIYVVASTPLAHISATVQILLDNFAIEGIIDYGKAASVSNSVRIADVAVINKAAFTSAWSWKDYEGSSVDITKERPTLKFGDYNLPNAGENKLGIIEYYETKKYTPKGSNEDTFWYPIDPEWFKLASELKVKLNRCYEKKCVPYQPIVVHGATTGSSDAYMQNVAYGEFLNKKLSVSTIDLKSAATVSTAIANGVKHFIVFRAPSNEPGEKKDSKISDLAGINNLKVVSAFVDSIATAKKPRLTFNNVLRLN